MDPGKNIIKSIIEKVILEGKGKGQRDRGYPKKHWEKGVEEWIAANIWIMGQRAEHRLMYSRSIIREREREIQKEREGEREKERKRERERMYAHKLMIFFTNQPVLHIIIL